MIDWEDAALGDPMCDVACARVELLCAHRQPAMDLFTNQYAARAPIEAKRLVAWEIYASAAALASMAQWGLPPEVENARRQSTKEFFEQAAVCFLLMTG